MTPDEHRERHALLHKMLDELVADYLTEAARYPSPKLPSNTTILELMKWSHAQTINPDQTKSPNDV